MLYHTYSLNDIILGAAHIDPHTHYMHNRPIVIFGIFRADEDPGLRTANCGCKHSTLQGLILIHGTLPHRVAASSAGYYRWCSKRAADAFPSALESVNAYLATTRRTTRNLFQFTGSEFH